MTKQDLIDTVSQELDLPKKQVTDTLKAIMQTIQDTLASGEEVRISGFGIFEIRRTKERAGVKPGTNERITIPARNRLVFRPSNHLKEIIQ